MMLFFVSIIAICGILYELLIGTLSSYLIGNSVQQFSFVIGFFMSGMGIGAYFSRFLEKNALKNFFVTELILSIVGASSVILMKFSYIYFSAYLGLFQLIYFLITLCIGTFVGMEIPLIATIYKNLKLKSSSIVSDIFTFDYIGGLVASLIFPLILLSILGLYNISIFIGTINLFVGVSYLFYLKKFDLKIPFKKYFFASFMAFLYLLTIFLLNSKLENIYLQYYYKEPILSTFTSPYQEIVLTKRGDDFRMYLNGNLQFLSLDENMYHTALVDWPMNFLKNRENISVLVLGGGDGLATRNLLNYKNISKITLVDLDPKVVEIAKTEPNLVALNKSSLNNPKVEIISEDAFSFIGKTDKKYDFIIADFPDPRDTATAKLYSKEFYIGIFGTLKQNGIFVTQASNSFFSNKVLFSIEKTISGVFGNALAYHKYLPSFGDWGFVVSGKNIDISAEVLCPKMGCSYFDENYLEQTENLTENTLASPRIIEYYGEGYRKYNL
ncbi:polyamine aminopropyltransferase [Candidatus Gracilibacteria bacterium]|nr:polyamine aminopropyltransferase [Candidatus Gracilibacteria bacterium]